MAAKVTKLRKEDASVSQRGDAAVAFDGAEEVLHVTSMPVAAATKGPFFSERGVEDQAWKDVVRDERGSELWSTSQSLSATSIVLCEARSGASSAGAMVMSTRSRR